MAETAFQQATARDREVMIARQSADHICHLLREFIPDACFRDAHQKMAESLFKSGTELTSKAARQEYEALKQTMLATYFPPFVPKD